MKNLHSFAWMAMCLRDSVSVLILGCGGGKRMLNFGSSWECPYEVFPPIPNADRWNVSTAPGRMGVNRETLPRGFRARSELQ